jgi:beta-N-acetylhexosaminidase
LGIAAVITLATALTLTPQQKAALVVVSGLPAPPGVAGVIVQKYSRDFARPGDAFVVVDQEGGKVRTFSGLPPRTSARAMRTKAAAYEAGAATGRALRSAGVGVDLAPVLDLPDGPLGARHFPSPFIGVAFARGLASADVGACAKHFPGLGPLRYSTDERPYVKGNLRDADIAPYRSAVEADAPCVMVGHGVYPQIGPRRAVLEPRTYELLRSLGFHGVAMTDSLDVVRGHAEEWAVAAALAGADLLLFTSGKDAAKAIRVLTPLARRGVLDDNVRRILAFRARFRR